MPVKFQFTEVSGMLTCFSVGFAVRMVPELLAFPYPIGFDTVYYAAFMKSGVIWPHWTAFFTTSWLFPAISVSLYKVVGGDPFMLLKVLAPLLFGLNVAGIFWLARKMLDWDVRTSLLTGLFFTVQLASLRISWDLLRNLLGLGFLLFTLSFIKSLDKRRSFLCFVLFSLFSVFAHEYAAVTLTFLVSGSILWSLFKGEDLAKSRRLFFAFLPTLVVFLAGLYLRFFPIRYRIETNVIDAGDAVYASVGKFFFLTNYLSVRTSVDMYASYFDITLSVAMLFCLLYLSYIFLVWKGFFKNRILSLWTFLLSVGAFGCLVFPFCALQYWHRWMFMLVYPFMFYAVNGMKKCRQWCTGLRFATRKVLGMSCITVLLGCVYLATPVLMSTVNVGLFSFNPVNKYFSFAPTVPYQDVDSVADAMVWLDKNLGANDCLLIHHAFLFWGQLYLSRSHTLIHFENDLNMAVNKAYELGFSRVYFVWWNEPIGWYGITVPDDFIRLKDFCRISVYIHVF
ncbi:hypothetical protein KEJ24_03040 [Candidatus Bathyarchaeota archaeon]|nr:hypothetical protein [Candidatus Bathyarchaeota archaeon]